MLAGRGTSGSFRIRLNESGAPEVAELRNGSHSQNKWVFLKILPEKPAAALPGTQLSTNLSDLTTHLFFQNHDGDVSEYLGGYDTWNCMLNIFFFLNISKTGFC